MRGAYAVTDVRAAEAALMARVPEGSLMQRAATGLARTCALLLRDAVGSVVGARVVILVGSGSNGGDAMWAGAALTARGAAVTALLLSDAPHAEGLAALLRAGGRAVPVPDEAAAREAAGQVRTADLVLDGIVGIGGSGPLRAPAAVLARAALAGGGERVAVDLPSGTDPDTGAVPDAQAAFVADVTVTFGVPKPGLLLMPAAEHAGVIELVDIGLEPELPDEPALRLLDAADVALALPQPGPHDYKYSRGVVGVAAGSRRFPGAALLCTGAARRGGSGMTALLARDPTATAMVVGRFPDVVTTAAVEADPRIGAWVAGPGLGDGSAERDVVLGVLATAGPVLLDADALRLLAEEPGVREALADRTARGGVTVLTPHEGEFARLGFVVGDDRAGAARTAAAALGAVVLLKGATTVIAEPGGRAWVTPLAPAALATAGSGDVLSGLAGSMLAHAAAAAAADGAGLDDVGAASTLAAADAVHALAGRLASAGGAPVTAGDLLEALPAAVAAARAGLA